MEGLYRIAEKNIRIISLCDTVHVLCRRYALEEDACGASAEPDLVVRTTEEDIAFEIKKSEIEREFERKYGPADPDFDADNGIKREEAYRNADPGTRERLENIRRGNHESLAVYRKIVEKMPFWDTLLLHGSAVAVDGQAYLFTARSGTGKSTHTRLWREFLGDRAVMINDDKPLIRVSDSAAEIFGTPWDGKHHLSTNTCVPLKAVCILERAEENSIREITSQEALPILMQQTYRPMDAAAMRQTLVLISRLMKAVRFFRLSCNMDVSAAELSYSVMSR